MKKVVVALAVNEKGKFACATRVPEKDYYGKGFALPGGKVDEGESLLKAIYRECIEEGWDIYFGPNPEIVYEHTVEGTDVGTGEAFTCYWILGVNPCPLTEYKDKARGIVPVFKNLNELYTSGYHNHLALDALMKKKFYTPYQDSY